MKRREFIATLAAASSLGGATAPVVDWPKVHAETLEHFSKLLSLDTTNPPGNETIAARYISEVLERNGIPAPIYALEESRANVVARVKGNGSKRPLLLMGHTDVVGVQRDRWTVEPFAATRKNGFIYGRGATDDKDNVVASLMVLLTLKRMNVTLDRDVIFLAESGEEGTTRVGIEYMIAQHWADIDAEFCFAEGGGGLLRSGKPLYVGVSTAEKKGRGVWLRSKGTAGHGSMPRPDNAISKLANAVAKAAAWRTPVRFNDTTRTYFEKLATISTPDKAARYRGILVPQRAAEIDQYFAQNEIMHHSMLRTSIAPTVMRGGFRSNVIPSEAEAYLDIRALPDEDMATFYAQLRKVIGDPDVEISARDEANLRPGSPPSRLDSEGYKALEAATRRVYPGAIVIPNMMTGATDMAYVRAKGTESYGIGPLVEEGFTAGGAHTDDERILETSLYKFVEFLWDATLALCSSPV